MTARGILETLAVVAGVGVLALADATPVLAQCSMCRTALEQNPEAAVGFNRAILFLLATPYAVFATVAGSWAWRRRRRMKDVDRADAVESHR